VPRGDMPLRIVWQMNGADMSSEGVTTSKIMQRSSVLTIEAVTFRHRGEYSCVATNPVGQARYSSVLVVNGTPGFGVKKSKACVSFSITCAGRFLRQEVFRVCGVGMRSVCDLLHQVIETNHAACDC
jgi:hypothetical protein